MKRILVLLFMLLLIPAAAFTAADEIEETEETEYADDWREDWEDRGYFDFCDVRDDTLVIFEGVTAIGEARTDEWDEAGETLVDIEPKFEDGPRFDRMFDPDFHRVTLPSTLRFIGMEAFCGYDFTAFTLPAGLEVIERDAFVYCGFGVLRIEAALPAGEILGSLYDCNVSAYEVPENHPLFRTVDGVLFSKDGKTLIAYPNARAAAHYDVPAGVERIEAYAMGNEFLKTVSLPIGLKSIGDAAFAGCTRLQSIALPLTVREIGRDIFFDCVSLELVSLPDGLEAEKDDGTGYYPDDAVYRGDNGDTLAGRRSEGRVNAPGRVYAEAAAGDSSWYRGMARIYDTADTEVSLRYYESGKTVYMGRYENGRVALYEPLGGAYTGTNGYGMLLGWIDIANVRYLRTETLFTYAEVKPRSPMKVWWNHLPDDASWTPWETVIPMEGRKYKATLFGAFVRFDAPGSRAAFACAIQDADLTRMPDGTGHVYGIVFHSDFMSDIPLRAAPDGETLKLLAGGTQVRVLEEGEAWTRVTDGHDMGWVQSGQVRVVPEKEDKAE